MATPASELSNSPLAHCLKRGFLERYARLNWEQRLETFNFFFDRLERKIDVASARVDRLRRRHRQDGQALERQRYVATIAQ